MCAHTHTHTMKQWEDPWELWGWLEQDGHQNILRGIKLWGERRHTKDVTQRWGAQKRKFGNHCPTLTVRFLYLFQGSINHLLQCWSDVDSDKVHHLWYWSSYDILFFSSVTKMCTVRSCVTHPAGRYSLFSVVCFPQQKCNRYLYLQPGQLENTNSLSGEKTGKYR